MALFGSPRSFVGLDIGTASLKAVELINRHRRVEVATYAQADMANPLVAPLDDQDATVQRVAKVVRRLFDEADITAERAVAALPSGSVFSTVLELPNLPEEDMDRAVHAAARDVVPADLDEMVLGWSRVGELPHMEGDTRRESVPAQTAGAAEQTPVFVTAAPRDVVNRYTRVMELAHLELVALEVETFPLVRSLLSDSSDSALIVDIGAEVTTYHLIDQGTPRVSQTVDYGGARITQAIMDALQLSHDEAEQQKVAHGMVSGSDELMAATRRAAAELVTQGEKLLTLYQQRSKRTLKKTVLIGAGANLQGLAEHWSQTVRRPVSVGNPWRGLSYPAELEARANELAPTFAVAVGLAQRGLLSHRQ